MSSDSGGGVGWVIFFVAITVLYLAYKLIVFYAPGSYILIGTAASVGLWYWGTRWYENLDSTKRRKWLEEQAKEATQRAGEIAAARAKYRSANFPDVESFELSLAKGYSAVMRESGDPLILESDHAANIITALGKLYQEQFPPFPDDDTAVDANLEKKAHHANEAFQLFWRTSVTALAQFTQALPEELKRQVEAPKERGMFERPTRSTLLQEDSTDLKWPIRTAFQTLTNPFSEAQERFLEYGIDWARIYPYMPPTPRREDYRSDAEYRRADKQNDKDREEIITSLDPEPSAFLGTPFFPYAHEIFPAPNNTLPWSLPDTRRFMHQWLLGSTGAGKTTVLSNMILYDLERVAAGECSVVVMDSQNELIPELARLEYFAPGGSLATKLVYLEPDPDHPLALNIFDMDTERLAGLSGSEREQLTRGAMQMADFFMRSVIRAETSPQMDMVLQYVIPALMHIPDATISTLRDLLEPGSYERYRQHFAKLDPEVQMWLRDRLPSQDKKRHAGSLNLTFDAIRNRVDGFMADTMFRRMFRHPRSKFDFFTELQTPRVILINTKKALLKGGTEAFGRFFIAKLLQATEERMLLPRASRLPVYCYIDEATDYIAAEENIAELIDKARKQRVALVLAHQREDQIKSDNVLSALRSVGIQSRAVRPGTAEFVMGDERAEVNVPSCDLSNEPRMSDEEWDLVVLRMRTRYSALAPASPQRSPDEPEVEILPPQKMLMHRQPDAEDATADPSEDY